MTNINLVQVMGRLTRDPEVKTTQQGTQVAHIDIATNYTWKDKEGNKKEETEFHNAVAFGRTAEVIAQYFHKGDEIYVQGRLRTSSWEAKDGTKRYKTEIVLERFEFGQKSQANASRQDGPSQPSGAEVLPTNADAGLAEEIDIEDIPF